MKNYITYHLHTEDSLLDSCTNYKLYINKAKELGQTAICFTEHGNTYNWVEKKLYCENTQFVCQDCGEVNDKSINECPKCHGKNLKTTGEPIKYLHGVEIYLTETLDEKIRDNYHTVLIAKNYEGFKELNLLVDLSTQEDHFYYKPRISFDEFLKISDNIIKISACLASPLNKLRSNKKLDQLFNKYDYLEIQPHIHCEEQKEYNQYLVQMSKKYNKPLIAGTDTHSINQYKAECRSILQRGKKIKFTNEDQFDLTYKSYDELTEMFKKQGVLSEETYLQAIENTNTMANLVEPFTLDLSYKYPKLYDDEELVLKKLINKKYKEKIDKGIIQNNEKYKGNILEEFRVFKKIGMIGFMLFMSELITWCWDNGIPIGFCRGSVGGSTEAYITDIIDVDPIVWDTIFSRFANEDRKEIGDIDIDVSPSQRHLVYEHIIDKFGMDKTAYILAIGTISDKGTIDEIGRALADKWIENNDEIRKLEKQTNDEISALQKKGDANSLYGIWELENISSRRWHEIVDSKNNPYSLSNITQIKKEYEIDPDGTKEKYPDIFYYFDGLVNTAISQSMHPAGIIASPVTLPDNYGTFWRDGKRIICLNMEEVHEVSLVKYDILGLKNIEIAKDTCEFIGAKYPKSHEINWNDDKVWDDITTSSVGIFQFEGSYAYDLLKRYSPHKINDLSLINASLRPSGASYRDRLIAKEFNHNPSKQIDDLLASNRGFLVFQEDTIKFLQNICGLSGSEADNVRRAIGRKQKDRLDAALPQILEGYCNKSDKPREIAEQEAKAFLQIIEDSSNYQFGYNHSTGYSMIGYLCAYLRYYHPLEFITAYLNNANNDEDITNGTDLARLKGINIDPIRFRHSKSKYQPDKDTNAIYKGLSSVKYMSDDISNKLYSMRDMQFKSFIDFLKVNPCDSRQTEILIILGFFEEFGKSDKLLQINNLYSKIYGKKQFKKDKLPCNEEIIKKYSDSTDKTYKNIDYENLLNELIETIPDKDVPVRQQLKEQMDYIGYLDYTNPKLKGYYFVTDLNTKYSPRVTLYNLENGSVEIVKTYAKTYQNNPFDKGDVLQIISSEKKNKSQMIDGKWCKVVDEFDTWMKTYKVK